MCPTLLYWVYDAVLQIVESKFPDFKIPVMKESEDKNHVSKPTVIVGVLLQQFGQAMIAGLLFLLIGPTTLGHTATVDHQKTVMAPLRATVQFLFTLLVSDTWQFINAAQKQVPVQVYTFLLP
ncbi:hypothetical protein C1H46_017271 [Malus baccata]|uniref:Uncharacterized protein n=1 Tax=Malus baccata TaxID=106549 RepID=A0A540MF20_MALBA|nr:hypothetical protein C1H46_017271 [Malus baccata]